MKDTFLTRDVTEAKDGLIVYKNSYWACVNGNPKEALFYGKSPQCNKNIGIVHLRLDSGLWGSFENVSIVFIETAFVPDRN